MKYYTSIVALFNFNCLAVRIFHNKLHQKSRLKLFSQTASIRCILARFDVFLSIYLLISLASGCLFGTNLRRNVGNVFLLSKLPSVPTLINQQTQKFQAVSRSYNVFRILEYIAARFIVDESLKNFLDVRITISEFTFSSTSRKTSGNVVIVWLKQF